MAFAGLGLHNQLNKGGGHHSAAEEKTSKPTEATLSIPAPPANPEPSRSEWREEQDLNAQRQMAQWAFWMLVVSSLGVVVGATGLWFLKGTLDEARNMTSETRKIGQNQTRAYVDVVNAKVIQFEAGKPFMADLEIHNTGQTPARIKGAATTVYFPEWPRRDNTELDFPKPKLWTNFSLGAQRNLVMKPNSRPNVLSVRQVADIKAETLAVIVAVTVEYEDVFGRSHVAKVRLLSVGEDADAERHMTNVLIPDQPTQQEE